jgi:pyruvate dehydrogenase E2 component (dihydrolipoamide acetyltransferase)
MKCAMTPAARREAQRRNIDIKKLNPTGIDGYIQLSDVVSYTETSVAARVTGLARAIAKENNLSLSDIRVSDGARVKKADVLSYIEKARSRRIIPHSEMRKVIAKRMAKSMAEIPQYSMFGEYDATKLCEFMKSYAEEMRILGNVKPTYSDLFVKIVACALRDHEILNSTFHDDHVEIHPCINIGIAVALEDGLIVPNIKDADKKTLREITRDRSALVEKARKGRLLPDEYAGGTFTITNLGLYPVQYSTPIINQPESAILGIGMLADKVVPVEGGIGVRKMLSVSLTSDHRHIDGAKAAMFLAEIKRYLEQPNLIENSIEVENG